jgi:hypothetical protein
MAACRQWAMQRWHKFEPVYSLTPTHNPPHSGAQLSHITCSRLQNARYHLLHCRLGHALEFLVARLGRSCWSRLDQWPIWGQAACPHPCPHGHHRRGADRGTCPWLPDLQLDRRGGEDQCGLLHSQCGPNRQLHSSRSLLVSHRRRHCVHHEVGLGQQ